MPGYSWRTHTLLFPSAPRCPLPSQCPAACHTILQCPPLSLRVSLVPPCPLLSPCSQSRALGCSPTQALRLWGAPAAMGGWISCRKPSQCHVGSVPGGPLPSSQDKVPRGASSGWEPPLHPAVPSSPGSSHPPRHPGLFLAAFLAAPRHDLRRGCAESTGSSGAAPLPPPAGGVTAPDPQTRPAHEQHGSSTHPAAPRGWHRGAPGRAGWAPSPPPVWSPGWAPFPCGVPAPRPRTDPA